MFMDRYVFIADKGYQQFEAGESSVVTKVKGIQKNAAMKEWQIPAEGMIWDAADFVVPPLVSESSHIK